MKNCGQEPNRGINTQIRRCKWGWIGHTLRKTTSNVTRHALRLNPQGKRSWGHPRNSWRRTTEDEAGKAGYTWRQIEKLTQNRTRWQAASVGPLLHREWKGISTSLRLKLLPSPWRGQTAGLNENDTVAKSRKMKVAQEFSLTLSQCGPNKRDIFKQVHIWWEQKSRQEFPRVSG